MPLQRFIPSSPDQNIVTDSDQAIAKFGHLNTVVDYINNELAYVTPFVVTSSTTDLPTLQILNDGSVVNYGPGGNFKNTAFGYEALLNTTAPTNGCTAIGAYALKANTTGIRNTAVGVYALDNNLTGCCNVAIGQESMDTSTTGGDNVSIGFRALKLSDSATANTSLGALSGYDVTTGGYNTFVGHSSGRGITTGTNNTIIGRAQGLSSSLSNNIILADGSGNKRLIFDNLGAISVSTIAVTTETVTSDRTLSITINGTPYKILLKS